MRRFGLIMALALVALMPSVSRAGFVINFNVGNPNIDPGNPTVNPPYARLTIDDPTTDPGLAANNLLHFHLEIVGGNSAGFGRLGWNLNGVTASDYHLFGTPTGTPNSVAPGGDPSLYALIGSKQFDGFGTFDEGIGEKANNRLEMLDFFIQFNNAADATIASVNRLNSGAGNDPGSWRFALEYFPDSGGTGYVGARTQLVGLPPDDPPIATPEPSTIVMLGSASVIGLGAWYRRRRQEKAGESITPQG